MDKNDIINYVMHTPHNTNRAVLSSMLNQLAESGDGDSWTVLTEESVTTEAGGGGLYETSLKYSELIAVDSVKITFNSVEYTCTNISEESGEGAYGAEVPDWSTYPFRLESSESPFGGVINHIITETAGTYTIKIEAPQSGGSSDFSTAEVTIVDNTGRNILLPLIMDDEEQELHTILNLGISESGSYTVPLYKGSLTGIINEGSGSVNVSGNIDYLPNRTVVITGDCTITISHRESD